MDLVKRQQVLINLISRVGRGQQNIYRWVDELMEIDAQLEQQQQEKQRQEQETKTMSKAVTYKGYQLNSSGVYFEGKLLPQDNWCLSKKYGVVLLNEKDADFDPNFELGYDLSGITLTVAEEKQYKNLLPLQRRVEESIKNNEWQYKSSSSTEQDIYGDTTTVYTRWEHPEFGVFEKTYDSQHLTVPTKYSAEYFKAVCLNVHRAAALPVLRFQAWVDYWEKINLQPKKDPMNAANAVANQLKKMGVFPESLLVEEKKIIVKGADTRIHAGKEYYFDAPVWFGSEITITPEQIQTSFRSLYSEYKQTQGNKPVKSFDKWLEVRLGGTTTQVATQAVVKSFSEGQKVVHQKWGQGTINRVMGSTLSVNFNNSGIKLVDAGAVK